MIITCGWNALTSSTMRPTAASTCWDQTPVIGNPRYSPAEGSELMRAARDIRAEVVHVLDFRIPLEPTSIPVITTVHDVLRLDPRYCYIDGQFTHPYGPDWLEGLRATTLALRARTDGPWEPRTEPGLYAECYARIPAWTCQQASAIVTPTEMVTRQLARSATPSACITTLPPGIDHLLQEDGPLPAP